MWLAEPARARRAARRSAQELERDGARSSREGVSEQITVFTHRRPEDTTRGAARARSTRRPQAGVTLRLDEEETRKHGPAGRSRACELDAPVQGRRRAVRGARRRRHDPARAAALRRHRGAGVRDQLRRDRLPRDGRAAATCEDGIARALSGDFELLRLPAIVLDWPRRSARPERRLDGDQRRRDPPQGRRAGRRARLRARRRGGRQRALRRPRGRHAGGLDRLQPRQRRPGDGVGGGGLRRVVHRAALADRARARGRARTTG